MLDVCIPYAFRPVATRTANARSSCCHYCIFVCWNWNFSPLNLMHFWLSWRVFRKKKSCQNLRKPQRPVDGNSKFMASFWSTWFNWNTEIFYKTDPICHFTVFLFDFSTSVFFPSSMPFGTVNSLEQRQNQVVPCFACLFGSSRHLFESCAGL